MTLITSDNPPYFQAVLLDRTEHAVDISLLDDGGLVLYWKANQGSVRLTASQKAALKRILDNF